MKENNGGRNRLIIIALVLVVAISLLASDNVLQSAALISAGIEMPQGASSLLVMDAPAMANPDMRPIITRSQADPPGDGFDITATPADILLLMEEAVYEFADHVPGGNIVAHHFTNADATHYWGNLAVHNITATQAGRDLSRDLATPIDLQIDKSLPAVLIYHTHTTEGFEILSRPWYAANWHSRTENYHRNIVRVGEAIAQMLERAGFVVIHDTTVFDVPFAGAYNRSRMAVEYWLARYPSIQLTIDVHRDAIHRSNGDRIHPVAEIMGRPAAQVMLLAGVEEGDVPPYPNWEQNLALASRFHVFAQERYPGLMRPLWFTSRRFNMDLAPYAMFFEVGSDVSTLQEAVFSGKLIGEALAAFLEDYVA